jgi:hypothetical protein
MSDRRLSKKQKLAEAHAAYQAAKTGQRPRQRAKDGSIPTHPTVPVKGLPEAGVLAECRQWLKAHRIFHDRHDCGAGDLGHGFATYGIVGAGDIIGILPNGIHFEIETKAGHGGRLSVEQQKRMADVRATGAVYLVVHGIEELMKMMKGFI